MVGRAFLFCADYQTVQEIRTKINQRNLLVNRWDKKPMSLSTVSKVLKTLQDDLIVTREETIHLLQPDKLLGKLRENYVPPAVKEQVRLKISEENGEVWKLLSKQSKALDLPLIASETSSVARYTVLQRGDLLSVYCPKVEVLLERLPGSQSDRFPNLELLATEDETVYFDARQEGNFWWTSPVQVYLELMTGDKRDPETAEQLKAVIFKDFACSIVDRRLFMQAIRLALKYKSVLILEGTGKWLTEAGVSREAMLGALITICLFFSQNPEYKNYPIDNERLNQLMRLP